MDFKKFFEQYLDFVKKYIPEPKVKSSVGIDVGLTSCKMVEVRPKGSSFELVQWAVEPIKGGDAAVAVKVLMGLVESPDISPTMSVHGKGTLIRYIDIPRMSLDEIRKSFSYEVDKYLPFTADQIYFDCMILDPKGKGNKMTVMVAAAKKEIVNEQMDALKNAGIHPDFITLNSIAMANVIHTLGSPSSDLNSNGEKKEGAVAVVDIGEKVTNVTIVYDGLPHFTRDIFIAGDDFTKGLSNKLGISIEEAEALKRDSGKRKEEVVAVCEAVVMNLISDLRLSFDYFVTEHNILITKIYLSGGGSLLEGVIELFLKYLEIEVMRWDSFEHVEMPDEKRKELGKVSGQFGVALGLALH